MTEFCLLRALLKDDNQSILWSRTEANKAQLYFCDLTKYTVISWVILIAWATASMDYEQSAALVSGVLRLVTSPLDTHVRMHSPR